MSVTAGQIMDRAAALLSDPSRITFTYTLQLPFLLIAWDELQEDLVSASIMDVEETTSAAISVTVGTTELTSGAPADLLFPLKLWERAVGGTDSDWEEMEEKESDPDEVAVDKLDNWWWSENVIKFKGATTTRQIKIRYQKELATIGSDATVIPVTNCKSFLSHRTAAIIAGTRGNKIKAASLDSKADVFRERLLSTKVKDMQDGPVRPHRYGASRRG